MIVNYYCDDALIIAHYNMSWQRELWVCVCDCYK